MPTSNRLRKGDRVWVLSWNGKFLRAVHGGTEIFEVLYTEPVPSDRVHKARTRITFTNGQEIVSLTNAEWNLA